MLRSAWRLRLTLLAAAARAIQHRQKALTPMQSTRQPVVRALTAVTGLRILPASLTGERAPRRLAALRAWRCLARLIYAMLQHGSAYVAESLDTEEQQYRQRVVHNLSRRARDLGYDLVAKREAVTQAGRG